MRKIEEAMCAAVKAHKDFYCGNTRVRNVSGISHVYLHENLIAIVTSDTKAKFSLAGWNTATTRSRLRALGINVIGKLGLGKKPIFYKGLEIKDNEWYNK